MNGDGWGGGWGGRDEVGVSFDNLIASAISPPLKPVRATELKQVIYTPLMNYLSFSGRLSSGPRD